ncbi:MAG: rimO [Firmicutes bacterium]|nr:rimO [Bacillota bacterium]
MTDRKEDSIVKAGFISLGCAKNLVDTEVMLGLLASNGIQLIDEPKDAEILIINTCTFIDAAKEESVNTILETAKYKQSGKCRALIVAGCLGQRYQQGLLDELPEVDAVLGTGSWHRINEAIAQVLAGERVIFIGKTDTIYDENMPRIKTTPVYSSYVKVAEGCSNNCSYCVIPLVRGAFRSRTVESVVNEVKQLVAEGTKEINLIAQDTTSFGRDLSGGPQLAALLRELVKIEGLVWIRLLYCYPQYFTDEVIELIAEEPKLCKYVDLPLQHIHDDILAAMNRRDRRADIEKLLKKIRATIKNVAIRTSFIVGFPGETEEQFQALEEFVAKTKFDHVGVFTYSREEDTVAAKMPNQIAEDVKEDRYHRLMALQSAISEEINTALEGQAVGILVEGRRSDDNGVVVFGRAERQAPEIDGIVYLENAAAVKTGDFVKAKIVQGFTYDLLAEII